MVLAVVVATILAVSTAAGAQAPTTSTTPPPASTAPAAGRIDLAGQTAWVAPGGVFDLRVRLTGVPAGSQLVVQAHPKVSGRIRFEQTTKGENLGAPLQPALAPVAVDQLAGDGDGSISLSLPVTAGPAGAGGPAPAIRLPATSPAGVYPVSVRLVGPTGDEVDRLVTHLVVVPVESRATPLAMSLVIPAAAPLAFRPDGTVDLSDADRERLATTIAALDRAPAVAVSVAASPETLDALATDPAGAQLVQRMGAALTGDQLMAATYVPVDLGAWAADRTSGGIADHELQAQLAAGEDTLTRLTGTAPDRRTWLVDRSVTPGALDWLVGQGVTQVVVPEDQVDPLRGTTDEALSTSPFLVEPDDGDPIPALLADATVAARLHETDDPVLNGHLLLANLAVLQGDRPNADRGVVVQVPANEDVPATTWDTVLQGLASAGSSGGQALIEPLTLDALFQRATSRVPSMERSYRYEAPASLGRLPAEVAEVSGLVTSLATMVGEAPVAGLRRQVLVTEAAGLGRGEQIAYLDGVRAGITAMTSSVIAPDEQRVTITEDVGKIPLVLENRLPYPVQVEVVLRSAKLEFPEGTSLVATLAAEDATRLEVAVEARASGAFPLDITVRTPDGGMDVAATRFTVRSTAISGLGLGLSLAAGAFLLVWWARHFRRTRRARRLVSPNHPSVRGWAWPAADQGSATLRPAVPEGGMSEGNDGRSPDRH